MPTADDLKQSMCVSLAQMGDNHYQLGQLDKAVDYYKQALSIAHETAEPGLQRRILVSLALSALRQAKFDRAVEYYEQALKAAPRSQSREGLLAASGEVQLLLDLGKEFYRYGDLEKAAAYVENAVNDATEMRSAGERNAERIENLARAYLGIIMCGRDDITRTHEYCSAAATYAQSMSDDLVLGVAQTGLGLYQALTGQSSDAIASLSSAAAKLRAADEPATGAEALAYLCWCMAEAGQPDAALGMVDRLPAQDDQSVPRRVRCVALTAAGLAQALTGHVDQALATCRSALALAQEVINQGDQIGLRMSGRALVGLGVASTTAGHLGEAMASLRQALAMAETSEDPILRVRATLGMGEAILYSNPQEARITFEKARSLAEALANPVAQAMALAGLGQAQAELGNLMEADGLFAEASTIAEKTGDARSRFRVTMQSGDIHRATGQHDIAVENYQKALEIARAGLLKPLEAQALGGLGLCLVDTGDPGKAAQAVQYLSEAQAQAQADGSRRLLSLYQGALGTAYAASGQTNNAIEQYRLAIASAQEIGDRAVEGAWLGNLANLYTYLDQPGRAIETYQKAIQISEESEDRATQARLLVSLGLAYSDLDHISDAIAALRSARGLFSDLGNSEMVAQTDSLLTQLGA